MKTRPLRKRLLKSALIFLVAILMLFVGAPFLIPVDAHSVALPVKPYENSEHFDASGVNLHYRVWEAAAPIGKVLLIHGFGGSTSNWQQNVDALNQAGYTVVAADLPGFGYSSRQAGLNHSQSQRSIWLWQLLGSLDDNRFSSDLSAQPWVITGHSMGAGTALAMAVSHPDQTAQLILVDGAIFANIPAFVPSLMHFPPLDRWFQVVFNYVLRSPSQLSKTLASAFQQQPTPEQLAEFQDPFMIQGTARVLGDQVRTAGNEPAGEIANLKVPVYAIWGEKDTWVPLSVLEQIKSLRPNLQSVIIADAGHIPMITQSSSFNDHLLKFLMQNRNN